jgi:hypothetical protein
MPPGLIVVRLRAQLGGAAVDLLGGLAELVLAETAQRRRLAPELLLPGGRVGEGVMR